MKSSYQVGGKFISSRLFRFLVLAYLFINFTSCACDRYCRLMGSVFAHRSTTAITPVAGQEAGRAGAWCEICFTPPGDTSKNGRIGNIERIPMPGEFFATTVFAGPNMSFKSSDEEYSYGESKHKPGIGAEVGVSTTVPMAKRMALTAALSFKQNRASEQTDYNEPGTGGGSEYKDTYTYNYLAGSILAQYRLTQRLSVVAGPEVNYLVSANVKNSGGGSDEKTDIKKNSMTVGLDAKVGLKYEIPAPNRQRSKWGVSLIYDHRISRLNKKEDAGMSIPAYKMRSVNLGLNYFICGKCSSKK